jgi:hypothetical protein
MRVHVTECLKVAVVSVLIYIPVYYLVVQGFILVFKMMLSQLFYTHDACP